MVKWRLYIGEWCSVLLLDRIVSIVSSGFEGEFAFNAPGVVVHVVHVEVLVGVVPTHHVQEVVVVENVVAEGADLGEARVPLHQVLLDVEAEAFMSSDSLVEAAKDQDSLAVDGHAHGEVTGRPGGLSVQVDHPPHVVVDVVHFDGVCDLLLVELGTPAEDIDVLVVEDATGGGVTCNVQVRNSAPSVILDVVLLARRVKTLRIVATDHKDEPTLRIQGREVRSLEQKR